MINSPLYTLPDENTQPRNARRTSLNNSDNLNPLENIKSCFSEEDEDSQPYQETERDILQIAEKQDELKASRDDLVLRMSMGGKPLSEGEEVHNKEALDIRNIDINTKKQQPTRNESSHFQRYAVNDNHSPYKKDTKEGATNPVTPETLEDNEGNLDEKLSDEPPRAIMPKHHNVQTISDECKIKPDGNRSVGAIPEAKFKTMHKTPLRFPAAGLPIIEGFLKKKSTNMLKLWQRRYYVLKNKKLYYYENEGKEIKAGVLDFDLISVQLETGKDKRKIKIVPVGGSRKFLLKAADEEEAKKWLDALDKHIKASKGHISALCKTAKVKRFWKSDRIAQRGFLQQADTGDLLLFRTKNIGARITRSFTFSDYDHVALLLRFHTGDIVLFEATGKTGVGLCRWTTFIESKWHLLYSKIVYRKLTMQRSEEVINGMEKFVKYSVGKKYKVSAKKLLKKKVKTNEDENQENRTFFCSELVAACYKKVGLLPPEVSAARYFPGTFAAEKKLQLSNNAKLSDEYLIDFEL